MRRDAFAHPKLIPFRIQPVKNTHNLMGEDFIQPTRALSARLLKTTENCICAICLTSGRRGSDLALCGNRFERLRMSARENPNPVKEMNSSSVISWQTKQIPHGRRAVYAVWKRQATIRIRQHAGVL